MPKGPQANLPRPGPPRRANPSFRDVFGRWLCDMAEQDPKLAGITPAMCEGSGMVEFAERFPSVTTTLPSPSSTRSHSQPAWPCDGLKPVVAIYSTFLQRAYDQLIHDVAIQNLDVTFAIDRAGLVGQDGPTHHGAFDLSYLRCIPNMVIGAPSDENECRQMLYTAYQHPGPAAVRYPRGTGTGALIAETMTELPIGKAVTVREGHRVAILAFGTVLPAAVEAGAAWMPRWSDMRWVKPLDGSPGAHTRRQPRPAGHGGRQRHCRRCRQRACTNYSRQGALIPHACMWEFPIHLWSMAARPNNTQQPDWTRQVL